MPDVADAAAVAAPPRPSGKPLPAWPPVELAVAEAEPVALDAPALELAAPPLPPGPGSSPWKPKLEPPPPRPPKDVASADAAPELIDVVAVELAQPPAPPRAPGRTQLPLKQTEPPLPPVAVAVFDGSLGVVVVAVAEPPAPPGAPLTPFAPVTVTLPACADIAPAASKPTGDAVANSSRHQNAEQIGFLIPPSRIAFTEAGAKVGRQRKRPMSNCKSLVTLSVLGVTITQLQIVRAAPMRDPEAVDVDGSIPVEQSNGHRSFRGPHP